MTSQVGKSVLQYTFRGSGTWKQQRYSGSCCSEYSYSRLAQSSKNEQDIPEILNDDDLMLSEAPVTDEFPSASSADIPLPGCRMTAQRAFRAPFGRKQ